MVGPIKKSPNKLYDINDKLITFLKIYFQNNHKSSEVSGIDDKRNIIFNHIVEWIQKIKKTQKKN